MKDFYRVGSPKIKKIKNNVSLDLSKLPHVPMGIRAGDGGLDIDVGLEVDFDDSNAVERLRLDVLNIIDRSG